MGNTQGVPLEESEKKQCDALAITGPTSSRAIVAKKGGRRKKGPTIAVRTVTEVRTDPNVTVFAHLRLAEERALKAEVGRTRASIREEKWKSEYEKQLEKSRSGDRGEKMDCSLSQSSLASGPSKKRRRSSEKINHQSTEIIHDQSTVGNSQTVSITQYTKMRGKLESECRRLRGILARVGVDEDDFQDVKPELELPSRTRESAMDLTEDLKN